LEYDNGGSGAIMKTLAIVVGGGPSPGINAVIAAATIEARNHGLRVVGVQSGFRALVAGDLNRARPRHPGCLAHPLRGRVDSRHLAGEPGQDPR
jgi:hypothetical protein